MKVSNAIPMFKNSMIFPNCHRAIPGPAQKPPVILEKGNRGTSKICAVSLLLTEQVCLAPAGDIKVNFQCYSNEGRKS